MTRNRIVALALAALAVVGIGVSASSVSSTQAAWTDEVYVTATVTSGTWRTVGENTCTAWDQNGNVVEGCEITEVAFHGWGTPGSRSRQYTIRATAPEGWRHITFDADLTESVDDTGSSDPDPNSFDWQHAVLTDVGNFAPAGDWTCAELPTLRGVGGEWQLNFSFRIVEDGNPGNPSQNVCG